MSYLMVEQLENNDVISTSVTIKRSCALSSVRLGLFKKGNVVADLSLTIKNGSTVLSQGFLTPADIALIPGTYFHGMIDIVLNKAIEIPVVDSDVVLTFEIAITNYTNSDSVYLGLIREPNPNVEVNYDPIDPVPADEYLQWVRPYKLELFSY